ncbi:alkanesulfonate monooxygenase SsuD/methylene tetrahydromethanopterin reductase-like flavin-dependent oxidoreductase (luciferase family) [Labrys monachus]|uniref:Alkanesulfonate monooxygenase SsuD/methylene tetrahydromethanopterin reductase-like flavin-dependent oxidoreductase (Luciferase family) n=2 Tax=Labrys monachus TaxID=217067 RepID=A0ABU0F6L6_9HYPH|nr:LLM class flavin-dependent oxidoreductase [Labrys monachus]MDQ0390263.1 alkanesulfonate monooxygenase SsuD/methylene tetrahydromethanopterin reductase-like flavin-dependent oxidoreductase (luciferase family) [Labrys monachus]
MHNLNRDYHTTLQEDIEAVKLADVLGYEEFFMGEHYTCEIEQVSSPMMFLAYIAEQTKTIKLGTGVLPLPLYHPVMAASHIALLDHLTKGRLILGVGTGALGSDFEAFGMSGANRPEMMLDSLDIILKIWSSNAPYDIKGKHWTVQLKDNVWPDLGVGALPKTYQLPHPPLALSVSSPNSHSIRVAAQRDMMPISANFVAAWVVKTHWETYVDEMTKLGKTPDGSKWRVARSIFVADTDEAAEAYVKTPGGAFDWYYDYMFRVYVRLGAPGLLAPHRDTPPEAITHEMVRDNFVICGSPKTVAEKILKLREEVGPFGTLMLTAHDWTDKAVMRKSMELMAKTVMPMVNAALGEDQLQMTA